MLQIRRLMCGALAGMMLVAGVCAADRPAAVVTDSVGRGDVVRATAREPLHVLTELGDGALLDLPAGTQARFIAYWIGQAFAVDGPARVRIGYSGPAALDGNAPRRLDAAALPPLNASGYARPVKPQPAGNAVHLALLAPVGTRVLGLQPEFSWTALPGAEFRFSVSSDRGATVYTVMTRATSISLPDARLEPGKPYGWQVEARHPAGQAAAHAVFSTVLPELAAETRQFKPAEAAPLSEWVAYALWLRQLRFGAEERKVWQRLVRQRPDEPLIRAMAEE